eukprot:gene6709-3379_t
MLLKRCSSALMPTLSTLGQGCAPPRILDHSCHVLGSSRYGSMAVQHMCCSASVTDWESRLRRTVVTWARSKKADLEIVTYIDQDSLLVGPLSSTPSTSSTAISIATATNITTSHVELREYQERAVTVVLDAFNSSAQRQLLSMPTGAGKTVVFCSIARRLQRRTLILINREELVAQTVSALARVWPEATVGVVQGNRKQYDRDVVVATVQTASNLKPLAELSRLNFEVLVVDEAHHSTAQTYRAVMEGLGFLPIEGSSDPVSATTDLSMASVTTDLSMSSEDSEMSPQGKKMMLGVTATAYRRDKAMLSDVYEDLAFEVSLGELIEDGYLCRIKAHRIITYTDISNVKSKKPTGSTAWDEDSDDEEADFNIAELNKIINTPERNALVVDTYNSLADGRKGIAFCCSIEHGEDLSAMFMAKGVPAACLHSKLKKQDRAELLDQHRRGEVRVLTNVGILTEGYDDSSINCIMMTRPTKSTGLYTQCVGRGLRPHPGKEDCLILDFTDIDHGPGCSFFDYDGPRASIVMELRSIKEAKGGEMMLYGKLTYPWVKIDEIFYLKYKRGDEEYVLLRLRPEERGRLAPEWWLESGHASLGMEKIWKPITVSRRDSKWRDTPGTDAQIRLLRDHNVPEELLYDYSGQVLTKGQLADMISTMLIDSELNPKSSKTGAQMGWRDAPASEAQEKLIRRMFLEVLKKVDNGYIRLQSIAVLVERFVVFRGLDDRMVPDKLRRRLIEEEGLMDYYNPDRYTEMSKGVAHDLIQELKDKNA